MTFCSPLPQLWGRELWGWQWIFLNSHQVWACMDRSVFVPTVFSLLVAADSNPLSLPNTRGMALVWTLWEHILSRCRRPCDFFLVGTNRDIEMKWWSVNHLPNEWAISCLKAAINEQHKVMFAYWVSATPTNVSQICADHEMSRTSHSSRL